MLLGLLCSIVSTQCRAKSLSDADIDFLLRGIPARTAELLDYEVKQPFPALAFKFVPREGDIGDLGRLKYVLAVFSRNRSVQDVEEANQILLVTVRHMPTDPTFKSHNQAFGIGPDQSADMFHFQRAQLLYRIAATFGDHGGSEPRLLRKDVERASLDLLFEWARTECRLKDGSNNNTWRIWGSENHAALRDAACWGAANILANDPTRVYQDGSSAKDQLAAWTDHLKSYLRERLTHGTLIEYFSPTYSQYTLLNFYLYYDFSKDPELRYLARQMLDLWWSIWAQEQVDGVHGGSKARAYIAEIGKRGPLQGIAWVYFGMGRQPAGLTIAEASIAASTYKPPPVVVDIAVDDIGRGEYAVKSRSPGLISAPTRNFVYEIDSDDEPILRYTYGAAGFVLGSTMLPKMPSDRWAAISSQNRQNGIIMAGGSDAFIAIAALPSRGRSSYNALWAVQNRAAQISGPLPADGHAGELSVFLGSALTLIEQDSWLCAQGAAYVAVRPAWGGFHLGQEQPRRLHADDQSAPVILQAAPQSAFPTLSAFCLAVSSLRVMVSEQAVTFRGLADAGLLSLPIRAGAAPSVNEKDIAFEAPALLESPFMRLEPNGTVHIQKGDRTAIISPRHSPQQ